MKKLITLALAIAIPSLVHAQGTINFSSTAAAHVVQQGGVSVASGFANVALYGGTNGTPVGSMVLIGASVLNGAGGGISGGLRSASNIPGGAIGQFQVRAWTGNYATYELAVASGLPSVFRGTTPSFTNLTGDPNAVPPGTPQNLTGWTTPIALVPVPEPTTITLGILGAGSLLFLRRKK